MKKAQLIEALGDELTEKLPPRNSRRKEHKYRAHAPLAPSASKRWIACPGSFVMAEGVETEPSEAALEGTRAHEWAERLMKAAQSKDSNEYARELLILEKEDDEMAFHIDNYIDFLDDLKENFMSDQFDEYEEYIETRARFTEMIWGSLDNGIVRSKKKRSYQAVVSDLKYGRGVYVPAEGSTQLIIYLICLENYLEIRFEKAWLYIYQPRIPKEEPYEHIVLTRAEVDKWRDTILAAESLCLRMKAGEIPLEFKAGDHCQFCPAQAIPWPNDEPGCPTFRKHVQKGSLKVLDAPQQLPAVESLSVKTLVALHKNKKLIEHFLENVDHVLLSRGLRKQDIGDLKIVEGRSNRRWKDEDLVAKGLRELGAQPYDKKLITIGKAEKILGKNKINHLTDKPPGKVQLALSDDERPLAQLGKSSLALLK